MKYSGKLVFCIAFFSAILHANKDGDDIIKLSKSSIDARIFYFDRNFDKPTVKNSTAMTAGGIAKFDSGSFYGLSGAIAGYGSYLVGLTEKNDALGTSLLEDKTNNNISFLGESYLNYDFGKNSIRLGKQRLSTPLANDHDLRLLPSTYNASVFKSKIFENTHIELGHIKEYSGFASKYNGFNNIRSSWGSNGLAYAYVENSSFKNLIFRAQYINAIENKNISIKDYGYFDAKYKFDDNIYTQIQYGENRYSNTKDSKMLGLITLFNQPNADYAFLYNKIEGNNFKAIESGVMYSDWQQGYANYEPSEAFGGYVNLKVSKTTSIKLGKVNVYAKEGKTKDSFSESMIDFWQDINKYGKLRVRYSIKDETNKAYSANPDYPDRSDFRVIYYYNFSI